MLRFEWDRDKADANRIKHGVSFEEALTVFADPLAQILEDPGHSDNAQREIIIGHSAHQNLIVVSFREAEGKIRLISARRATRTERKDYEEDARR